MCVCPAAVLGGRVCVCAIMPAGVSLWLHVPGLQAFPGWHTGWKNFLFFPLVANKPFCLLWLLLPFGDIKSGFTWTCPQPETPLGNSPFGCRRSRSSGVLPLQETLGEVLLPGRIQSKSVFVRVQHKLCQINPLAGVQRVGWSSGEK